MSDATIENVTYTVADAFDALTIGTATVNFVAPGPMTISGSTSSFSHGSSTIAASVGGNACASITQSYGTAFTISLPGACSPGAITFTVAGQQSSLRTGGGASCLAFTADATVTGLQILVGGRPSSTCPTPASPVSPLTSTVTLAPGTVVADGASVAAITVTLKDGNGALVSGKTVTLNQTLQGGGAAHSVLTAINATTGGSGQASFSVSDATVENVSLLADDVTDSTPIAEPLTLSFVSAPASGSMTVSGTTSTYAGGAETILASVGGNACAGVDQSSSSFSLTLPSFCGLGAITFTVAGQTSGLQTSSQATCLPFGGSGTVSGVELLVGGTPQTNCSGPGPVSLANSSVVATPPGLTTNARIPATVIVTLEEASGAPVAGKTISLSQALAQGGTPHSTLSATTLTTASNGEALFQVKDSAVERVTFTAQDTTDNLTLTQTPTVAFLPPYK